MSKILKREISLRELLDRFVEAQRRDIQTYCRGHLNESNLYRPPNQTSYIFWNSLSDSPLIGKDDQDVTKCAPVKSSAGSGVLSIVHRKFVDTKPLPKEKTIDSVCAVIQTSVSDSNHDDASLARDPLPPIQAALSEIAQSSDSLLGKSIPTQSVVPDHVHCATKNDEFNRMREFHVNVLRYQDAQRLQILSGEEAVRHLEKKLQQDLNELNTVMMDSGPCFQKLEVFSDVFDELADSSSTFHYLLHQIKEVYDDYLASLLDNQSGGHDILRGDITRLSETHAPIASALHAEIDKVQSLEGHAKKLLEENERLRSEVLKEMELARLPMPDRPAMPPQQPEQLGVSEQIECLHTAILDKMEAVRELRTRLRTSFVPSSVCTYLDQCIRDTDVEMQKLISQKEYFEQSISKLEKDLQDAIDTADTTDHDTKRIWKRIELLKAAGDAACTVIESEEDESAKWSWYIS